MDQTDIELKSEKNPNNTGGSQYFDIKHWNGLISSYCKHVYNNMKHVKYLDC